MFTTRIMSCAVFASLTVVSLIATAQSDRTESPVTQANSTAPYQSVFSDYKGFQDPELVSWRKANDQVADTSGHGGHDMSNMNRESKGNEMASMPGHDMSKIKEAPNATKPAAGEANKNKQAMGDMPGMKGMDHSNMKHEKDKQ